MIIKMAIQKDNKNGEIIFSPGTNGDPDPFLDE